MLSYNAHGEILPTLSNIEIIYKYDSNLNNIVFNEFKNGLDIIDKIPRLNRLLIDYLGAEDSEYVMAVTRKTFVAAVARIYNPGIKFDTMLVLCGEQGIGKSTLFSKMGLSWYSDSMTISDMKDKTAAEKLQGIWITLYPNCPFAWRYFKRI